MQQKTPLCSKCWSKYIPEDVCNVCQAPLTSANQVPETHMCYDRWARSDRNRVYTITFHKDSEYESWLRRMGTRVEILSTTVSDSAI